MAHWCAWLRSAVIAIFIRHLFGFSAAKLLAVIKCFLFHFGIFNGWILVNKTTFCYCFLILCVHQVGTTIYLYTLGLGYSVLNQFRCENWLTVPKIWIRVSVIGGSFVILYITPTLQRKSSTVPMHNSFSSIIIWLLKLLHDIRVCVQNSNAHSKIILQSILSLQYKQTSTMNIPPPPIPHSAVFN